MLLFAAAGCKRTPQTPLLTEPLARTDSAVRQPERTLKANEGMGTLRWIGGARFQACGGRHVGDRPAREEGCRTVAVPGSEAAAAPGPGAAAVEGAGRPPAPCRVVLEWGPGDPGSPPARALLAGPRERQVLASWSPPPEVDGDRFVIEVAFSPDGKWMGVARESIGVGDEDTLVRIESVEVLPAPVCH